MIYYIKLFKDKTISSNIMESTQGNSQQESGTSSENFSSLKKISVSQLISWKNQLVKPIDGLLIPNITIPAHLVSKKRSTEVVDTLIINIRQLFNSLTADNIAHVKQQLKDTIVEKAKTTQSIMDIAQEILSNFLINEVNIKNYMHLLNAISPVCVLITNTDNSEKSKNVSPTIGNMFLRNCRDSIFKYLHMENIRNLALLDQDDIDEFDKYNREREKIINLVITICYLYEQRHTPNIKITAMQLIPLMRTILTNYQILQNKMKELGNPYEEDCSDEQEYEICNKMCAIYAEQIYEFINHELTEFQKDTTKIDNDETLMTLVEKFRTEVMPTLNQAYLISKCNDIRF